ncbi:peptide ABC transporter substrate-binding protein [Microbispora bryophytorum]|uniref:peptide ABC transporter substrate-binding protein n=1 Tax=Microbispora bryophytorum TaxID=1460882 RepID=UPI003712075E
MRHRRRHWLGIVLTLAAVWTLASCTGGPAPATPAKSTGTPVTGGTVTFAENQASGPVNYIFPLVSLAYDLPTNIQFQGLMYPPLYTYGNKGGVELDDARSFADPPVYSAGDKEVTIHLRKASWSDGTPVTARDVVFWINLLRANIDSWALAIPGSFPRNVTEVSTPDDHTVRLKLDKAYSQTWFSQTQLSQIYPVPQHVWDKTSAGGAVGDHDTTTAGAKAVYKFLDAQSRDLAGYAANPLWKVVDGAWQLSKFRPDGYAELVPNPGYGGTNKPRIDKFVMQPFTSDAAEFNVLRSGDLTYGYLPLSDISQTKALEALGYTVRAWPSWSISYIVLNFNNAENGAILKQLYVRQALQKLVDQPGYVRTFLKNAGTVTNGPVPAQPASAFLSPLVKSGVYPYDPAGAAKLLSDHGWTVTPDGVSTCAKPGTGAGQCGAGIAAGAPLRFSLQYINGVQYLDQEMKAYKSALSRIGVVLDLGQASASEVVSNASACSGAHCTWQLAQWGSPSWIWSSPYPSGESIFATGAGVNAGSYSDPVNDANIKAVQTSSGGQAFLTYEDYLAQQLPVIWLPNADNQVSVIKSDLGGVSQSPLLNLDPENWYFSR